MPSWSSGIDKWLGSGSELNSLLDLIEEDLVTDEMLDQVVGLGPNPDAFEDYIVGQVRLRPFLVALSARAVGAERVEPEVQHAAEVMYIGLLLRGVTLGNPGGKRRRIVHRVARRLGRSHFTVRTLELLRPVQPQEVLSEAIDAMRLFADSEAICQDMMDDPGSLATDVVLEHIDGYHSALMAFCCRSGGWIGGGDLATVTHLGRYGNHLGRLWTFAKEYARLTDPEGGAWLQSRARVGKPVWSVAVAMQNDEAVADRWRRVVSSGRGGDALVRLVRDAGGLADLREQMAQASWAAQRALAEVPDGPFRDGLGAVAARLARSSLRETRTA